MKSENLHKERMRAFFEEEYPSLKGFVRSRIRDSPDQEADDIIQEVALRIFSKGDDLSSIQNIGGFVYHAIRNRIIDVMRTRKKRIGEEKDLEGAWTAFAEKFYSASNLPYPEGLELKLQEGIAALKPPYRDIIMAVDFEGFSYRELSERTGIPQGTLMSRRHRAMSQLLTILERYKGTI